MSKTKLANIFDNLSFVSYILFLTDDLIIKIGKQRLYSITNSKAGSLIIDKRDSLTGEPLEGVTFKVTTSTGEYVPDENGYISSNGIYSIGIIITGIKRYMKTCCGYIKNCPTALYLPPVCGTGMVLRQTTKKPSPVPPKVFWPVRGCRWRYV